LSCFARSRWLGRLFVCQYLRELVVDVRTKLTAGNQDESTESKDECDGQTLLELHLKLHNHSNWETDDDEIGEDVEQDGDPIVDSRSLGITLVTRILGPSLVVRVALEQDVEEDCGICDSQTS
jgi:hypothetical protein